MATSIVSIGSLHLTSADSVIDLKKWQTQMPDMEGYLRTCKSIAGYIASKNMTIQLYIESEKNFLSTLQLGLQRLKDSLTQKVPVVTGVYWKPFNNHKGNNGLADHFIVITGQGIESNNKSYFRFFDRELIIPTMVSTAKTDCT